MSRKQRIARQHMADEVANVAELLMSDKGAFITGSTFLIDDGATASYFYGPLRQRLLQWCFFCASSGSCEGKRHYKKRDC